MSLSLAYDIARSGLATSGSATSVVARNIQNVGDANGSRKSAEIATREPGGAYVAGIRTAVNSALLDRVIDSESDFASLQATVDGLERLEAVVGDPQSGTGPAALMAELSAALHSAAQAPQDELVAGAAIERARELALGLNAAADIVASVRDDADRGIRQSVAELTRLLGDFEKTNREIVGGTFAGRDVTDLVDRRNAQLRGIAEIVGVRATLRSNNDMVLFTTSGATLFETVPRKVEVSAGALRPGQAGSSVRIDGVSLAAGDAARLGGRIGGLLTLRDETAVTFARQLDEMARGLVQAFAESDQSVVPTSPSLAGLFTFAGGPALPAAGILVDGLAAVIGINPGVDPTAGGDPWRLRDGGMSDPGNPIYLYNPAALAGFSDRLDALALAFGATQAFDPAAGLGAARGLADFAAASAGWLADRRATAIDRLEDRQVSGQRVLTAWQDSVGVNLDDELTSLIALERSYEASSRLMKTVASMFDVLLEVTR